MDIALSFGQVLKHHRKARDLTQRQLADLVGCATVTIQRIEQGRLRASSQIIRRLAAIFELPADECVQFQRLARTGTRTVEPTSAASFHVPLPTPLTPLIGRSREVAAVCRALKAPEIRLVTLIGPGGIGKTRVALQAAADVQPIFADGVVFVDLAAIVEPTLVASAIAQAVGLRPLDGSAIDAALTQALRDQRLLLVLDNFEHVAAAAALVADLLGVAPGVKALLTSRVVVGVSGEHLVEVPPLSYPDQEPAARDVSQLREYTAIRLFLERAHALQRDRVMVDDDVRTVAAICRRLDGLPLAIELAAARVRLLTPPALLARLEQRLPLLTGGARTLPERQRTLRTTIAWSYDLLTAAQQRLFQRLAVFVGGWTLDAAEGLCGAAVLDGLQALLNQSLIRQEAGVDGQPRCRMLETIREYALERLEASGEAAPLRRQHAAYYAAFGEAVWLAEDGPVSGGAWVRRLQPDYENFRSALAWSQTAAGDAEVALQLTSAMDGLWASRGLQHEAIAAMEQALAHPLGVGRTGAHWITRWDLARLHQSMGNYPTARMHADEALRLARELGDLNLTAHALERLGAIAKEQGDGITAWARLSESLALLRDVGDAHAIANALNALASVAILEEDPARAEMLLAESRALGRRAGAVSDCVAWMLHQLGHAAQLRGDYARAAQLHHESLDRFSRTDYPLGPPTAYHGLGAAALGQGNPAEALRWFTQGLLLSQKERNPASIAWCMAGVGCVAAQEKAPERAVELWGAAEAVRSAIDCRSAPAARAIYERSLALARAHLREEGFAAAWATGRALTLEQALAKALDVRNLVSSA